jgi:hypothetical protein
MFRKLKQRRWTLRAAVLTALAVSAVPASAAVMVSNFMKADISRNAACLTKIAGLDSAAPIVTTNVAATATGTGGVALLNESISLRSYAGDRTIATDSIRVKNTCTTAMRVYLKAEPGLAASTTSGDWTGLAVNVYLGAKTITSAVALNPALAATDFTVAADWDQAPIRITPGAVGVVANATTGIVSIPANSEIQLGVLADAGTNIVTTGANSVVNFTVIAAP